MTKSQLELALREAGKIARDRDFIVFGSQCILGTVARPPRTCLLSHHDLAASKLAASRKKDVDYVRALFSHGLINARILRERLRTLLVTSSSLQHIQKLLPKILAAARKPPVRSKPPLH